MTDDGWTRLFDAHRAHLQAVAVRMLGSSSEAEDALQEAWLKLSRTDAAAVDNAGGWLTTVVARVCLDMLRRRRSRREEPLAPTVDAPVASDAEGALALADAIGPALLVVLGMLAPDERVAFVLHDMFDLPFEEIARIVDRTPAAARQLASRARRRVRGGHADAGDREAHRAVVEAFLAASRDGDYARLVAQLAPDAVLRADEVAVRTAAANRWEGAPDLPPEVRGATQVAAAFRGRARGTVPAIVDGAAGAAWVVDGRVRAAFAFAVEDGRLASIEIVMDPARLAELAITIA